MFASSQTYSIISLTRNFRVGQQLSCRVVRICVYSPLRLSTHFSSFGLFENLCLRALLDPLYLQNIVVEKKDKQGSPSGSCVFLSILQVESLIAAVSIPQLSLRLAC